MDKFKNKYRIASARAKWHDYDGGIYFITICTLNHIHYFGEIANGAMKLSVVGEIVNDVLEKESKHYADVDIPEYVIMPNHIHLIIFLNANTPVLRNEEPITLNRNGVPNTELGVVIRNIKARISYQSRKYSCSFKWQSRYYDRIVRSQGELNRIAKYIEDNVAQWDLDELNKAEGEWY